MILVDDAIGPEHATDLRARADAAGFREHWIADRGRYEICAVDEPALISELRALAAARTNLRLGPPTATILTRLTHGSYALMKDDHLVWLAAAPARVELTLDLSAASSNEAQIVYTFAHGGTQMAPQRAGLACMVDRGPGAARYERYLPFTVGDARVYRLRLAFPTDGSR